MRYMNGFSYSAHEGLKLGESNYLEKITAQAKPNGASDIFIKKLWKMQTGLIIQLIQKTCSQILYYWLKPAWNTSINLILI